VSEYFDRAGHPISHEQWISVYGGPNDQRRVAFDENPDGSVRVSTVWLGLNHRWDPDGPPLIFETMVFGGPRDEEQWRWSTEEQARAGHAEICSAVLR
jgi:hypothetical protein